MSAHTPGSLTADGDLIVDAEGNGVAKVRYAIWSREIVRRWNAHEDLLAALEDLISGEGDHADNVAAARAAIAKARVLSDREIATLTNMARTQGDLLAALVRLAYSATALIEAGEEDGDAPRTLAEPLKQARAAIAKARGGK